MAHEARERGGGRARLFEPGGVAGTMHAATDSSSIADTKDTLAGRIRKVAGPDQREWFDSQLRRIEDGVGQSRILAAYSGAGWRMRNRRVDVHAAWLPSLQQRSFSKNESSQESVPAAHATRLVFLLACFQTLERDDFWKLVAELFRTGDNDERVVLLRALGFFGERDEAVLLAREACRSNVEDVFCAIAHDNPFPAEYFDDNGFNQMVVKAIFLRVGARRIVGVNSRINDELRRMLTDYRNERVAAERDVPGDVDWVLGL